MLYSLRQLILRARNTSSTAIANNRPSRLRDPDTSTQRALGGRLRGDDGNSAG